MTNEDRIAMREIVNDALAPICVKLDGIQAHLDRQNGSIARHEKTINEALEWRAKKYTEIDDKFKQYDECMDDVEDLKKESIGTQALKKYNARLFVLSTTIISIIIAIIGLWLHSSMGK